MPARSSKALRASLRLLRADTAAPSSVLAARSVASSAPLARQSSFSFPSSFRHAALSLSIRSYATSLFDAPSSSTGPAALALKAVPPSSASIAQLEEEGMDVELVPEEEACFSLTESAMGQLRKIHGREKDPSLRFRVAVDSGGCHGYQYKMELAAQAEPDDYTFNSSPDVLPVIIDATSLGLLKGSTLDFATELIGSSFRIAHNPQAKGSGCGCGVSWEAK